MLGKEFGILRRKMHQWLSFLPVNFFIYFFNLESLSAKNIIVKNKKSNRIWMKTSASPGAAFKLKIRAAGTSKWCILQSSYWGGILIWVGISSSSRFPLSGDEERCCTGMEQAAGELQCELFCLIVPSYCQVKAQVSHACLMTNTGTSCLNGPWTSL